MSIILHNTIQDAYDKLKADLVSKWTVDSNQLFLVSDIIKGIAKRQLSLSCTASVLGYRVPRNEYVLGLIEASYLSIILAVKGLENSAYVLTRQTIELTLKHIYFQTHPVEYNWANTREGYKELNFQSLIEYLKKTEEYQNLSSIGNYEPIVNIIEEKFSMLSRYVHVHSKGFINHTRINVDGKTDKSILRKFNNTTANLWPALSLLLIVFSIKRFIHANENEKRLIRCAMPQKSKTLLAIYLRNLNQIKMPSA